MYGDIITIGDITYTVETQDAVDSMNRNYATLLENVYTFYKAGSYTFTYHVTDLLGNAWSVTRTINVSDSHAPVIEDTNKLEEGETHYIVNIDNGNMCFATGQTGCLNVLKSYDYENGVDREIFVERIRYSNNGTSNWVDGGYVVTTYEEGLFRLKNIVFENVGYYEIVMASNDYNRNKSTITYMVKVIDTVYPEYVVDGSKVEGVVDEDGISEAEKIIHINYDADKLNATPGRTESDKFINLLTNWIKDNVKVDHNYSKDACDGGCGLNAPRGFNIENLEELILETFDEQEYARYKATLIARDSSENISKIEIIFKIMDKENPLNGNIEFSYDGNTVVNVGELQEVYTNANNLYFRVNGGSDNTNKYHYEYQIVREGNNDGNWLTVNENEFVVVHTAIADEITRRIAILYRVVDSVGNGKKSNGVLSIEFVFDKINPTITLTKNIINEEGLEEDIIVENLSVLTEDIPIRIMLNDDNGLIATKVYKNNNLIREATLSDGEYWTVEGFGHYKIIGKDISGNETLSEFIILPSDNTFDVVDKNALNDATSASSESKTYDRVVLQKINSDGNTITFDGDITVIGNNDLLYFMGVTPDKEGSIYSIFNGSINGRVFKDNERYNSYPINIIANVTNINVAYTLQDYVINFNGDKYILIGIEDKEDDPNDENNNSQGGGNKDQNNGDKGSGSFTWVFFVLGGIGAVGGVFVLVRLRKRVRAA